MLNYKESGVDINKADKLTQIIKNTILSSNIGLFAGIYNHPFIKDYSFVACTDGVGTKVIPLLEQNKLKTIATDLIAMNLNDLICTGAAPMFFLNYFATHSIDENICSGFIKELNEILKEYNCVLLGGETAELGDLITKGHFDVAGFAVGIVKKEKVLSKENVKKGDIVVGLESSGPHSNGYTLIRKLYEKNLLSDQEFESMLEPTYIYVKEILELCDKNLLKACANITGGGIEGNVNRIINDNVCVELFKSNIPEKQMFNKLCSIVGENESYKTFNMGVGMVLIISKENKEEVFKVCQKFNPFILGEVVESEKVGSVWLR